MAVGRRSVWLDADVADARALAARRAGLGFSAWLTRAARRALAVEPGLAAELAEADVLLDRWFPSST